MRWYCAKILINVLINDSKAFLLWSEESSFNKDAWIGDYAKKIIPLDVRLMNEWRNKNEKWKRKEERKESRKKGWEGEKDEKDTYLQNVVILLKIWQDQLDSSMSILRLCD